MAERLSGREGKAACLTELGVGGGEDADPARAGRGTALPARLNTVMGPHVWLAVLSEGRLGVRLTRFRHVVVVVAVIAVRRSKADFEFRRRIASWTVSGTRGVASGGRD
ncbi:hypothetical protein PLESTB_000322200 [Pleodorina starrii]|uniref:Uncharacterized protein n=1 Tax=Pleodorina starrii TaxID=330485 RepID=A0A9W6BE83_9CHLO|nr:hypothetical protein PLESTM_000890800 [Pleodorina starrii]GLC49911.1 hypothetical protein PLESTB_000322200 [Pleodorina starrii]GLC68217.1 hypothetical protein PLESTF_000663000 [Pleodorina starrii]